MPELPEVEITRQGLLPLLGRKVEQVTVRVPALRWPIPDHLSRTLTGQTLCQLRRRGKYILAQFETGCLLLHLGMSGRLALLPYAQPALKHDHFDLVFDDGRLLRLHDPRRFGALLWTIAPPEQHALLRELGVEPLDAAFDGTWLHHRLRGRNTAIKHAIMDHHLVVGVGNIYANEALFRAGIHPATPAATVSPARCRALAGEIKATLNDALRAGGSSLRDFLATDGHAGYFQQSYFVYGRTGQPCRRCGGAIEHLRQGQRSTFFCPRCQRGARGRLMTAR